MRVGLSYDLLRFSLCSRICLFSLCKMKWSCESLCFFLCFVLLPPKITNNNNSCCTNIPACYKACFACFLLLPPARAEILAFTRPCLSMASTL